LVEFTFKLEDVSPLEFFGPNHMRLKTLKSAFPDLKFTARGDQLLVGGDSLALDLFQIKFERILSHYAKNAHLSDEDFALLLLDDGVRAFSHLNSDEPIVFGPNGLVVKARSHNQRMMVDLIGRNDILFAVGPAGSGKTYTAVALAVRALKNREVKKIILTRPAVEAGENLGFLPGDLKEKIDPYLRPLYDALEDMLPPAKLAKYIEENIIEIAPLAFMRGRTLDKAFVILDEAQNTTEMQIKMFLTRMGPTAKFIITGDLTQIDLPRQQRSGLPQALRLLKDVEGIGQVFLTSSDVVRHRLVKDIIKAYDIHDAERKQQATYQTGKT
jgi:phosphate starvation-inducible PhoH-like protein